LRFLTLPVGTVKSAILLIIPNARILRV
jgi:hypothetical protein